MARFQPGMVRCVYCLERKPASAFSGREHVLPQAFGKFEKNLVLTCVCDECNAAFSGDIDLKLARDSIEGLDRFWSGMKSAAEFKSIGRRSTTTVRFPAGSSQGGTGYFFANPEGATLKVFAFPQIGFGQPPQPIKWFSPAEVPEKSTLAEHGIDLKQEFTIHGRELPPEEMKQLLLARGYDKLGEPVTIMPTNETIETTTVGIIGRPEMRAASKIALNYLAFVAGPALVRAAQFNEARDFARYDRGRSRVNITKNPWHFRTVNDRPARGHYLAVQTMPSGRIVAQVSLMLRLRYVVHLMSTNFATYAAPISSGHFFDIDARKVEPIPVPSLVRSERLNPCGSTHFGAGNR